jgi:hypothetical protein
MHRLVPMTPGHGGNTTNGHGNFWKNGKGNRRGGMVWSSDPRRGALVAPQSRLPKGLPRAQIDHPPPLSGLARYKGSAAGLFKTAR